MQNWARKISADALQQRGKIWLYIPQEKHGRALVFVYSHIYARGSACGRQASSMIHGAISFAMIIRSRGEIFITAFFSLPARARVELFFFLCRVFIARDFADEMEMKMAAE